MVTMIPAEHLPPASEILETFAVHAPGGSSYGGVRGMRLADGRTMYRCTADDCDVMLPTPGVQMSHRYREWPHKAGGRRRPYTDEVHTSTAVALPDMPEPGEPQRRPQRGDVGREAMLDAGGPLWARQAADFMDALVESRLELQEENKRLRAENDHLMRLMRETHTMLGTALGGTND